jgi:tRNA pseudouridine65 synthase
MLELIHRDEHIVAIHKPAGLLVHRSNIDRHETRFAVQLLRDQIGRHVHPAHRLDKGTSGLLLFALDGETARLLGQQFEAGTVSKTYRAIVRGWPPDHGDIDHPLTRQFDAHGRPQTDAAEPALPARTSFRRLASAEIPIAVDRYPSARYALVELVPHTGRQHQLRRHMKHIAHPIIGDATHGKGRHNRFFQQHFGCHRLLLACTGMSFIHPVSGTSLHLHAPLAEDFAAVAQALNFAAV